MPDHQTRISATFEVVGGDYDDLVAAAEARAEELMGGHPFWLAIQDVTPMVTNLGGDELLWTGTAHVVAPHDPAF